MKQFITFLTVVAIALLFFAQSDTFAKTEKQANKKLSRVNDGEVYEVEQPEVFNYKATGKDDEVIAPRFKKGFLIEYEAVYKFKRIGKKLCDWWRSILHPIPIIDPNYEKYRELEIAE